jgi:hypothetical protein
MTSEWPGDTARERYNRESGNGRIDGTKKAAPGGLRVKADLLVVAAVAPGRASREARLAGDTRLVINPRFPLRPVGRSTREHLDEASPLSSLHIFCLVLAAHRFLLFGDRSDGLIVVVRAADRTREEPWSPPGGRRHRDSEQVCGRAELPGRADAELAAVTPTLRAGCCPAADARSLRRHRGRSTC